MCEGFNGGLLPIYQTIWQALNSPGSAGGTSPCSWVDRGGEDPDEVNTEQQAWAEWDETGAGKGKKRKIAEEPEKQKKQRKDAGKGQIQFKKDATSKWAEIQRKLDSDPASIIGDLADGISFEESGKYIVRNGIVFSVSKLKAALHALRYNPGEDTCLACAIGTSSNSKINVAFCDQKHVPGHEHNGGLHVMPQGWAEKFNGRLTGKKFQADFVGPN